jgi:hypothetical protein
MIPISQRLRARLEPIGDGSGKWRPDGLCQEAADVNDALVAALENVLPTLDDLAKYRGLSYSEAESLAADARAALAKAKGKQE